MKFMYISEIVLQIDVSYERPMTPDKIYKYTAAIIF